MVKPDVHRGSPPDVDEGLILFCEDSPKRPGYEAQDGDVNYELTFLLYDGLQLRLQCGPEAFAHFTAILAASAADDADDQLDSEESW